MADLRFAAWFLWMMPLLTALSSCRDAACANSVALATSPASAASRNRRMCVRSADFIALLRVRAFSFVLFRLIWDLMFATGKEPSMSSDSVFVGPAAVHRRAGATPNDTSQRGLRPSRVLGSFVRRAQPIAVGRGFDPARARTKPKTLR